MTSEYLLFKTLIEVKIENEVKDGYMNSFPAISFCKENISLNKSKIISLYGRRANITRIFKDCLFDKEYNLSNNFETTNRRISYGKFVEILKNQTFVSQYLYYIDSSLFPIEYIQNIFFNRKIYFGLSVITTHSKDLGCLTYMSKLSKKYNSTFKLKENTKCYLTGLVHNPNNHNPCRSKSQHQNPNKYEIPTSYNPNRYKIPTNQNPNKPEFQQ
jgi:hypothetical protein